MKLRDEERREGGVIGRSEGGSSDQRDRRTEEKERQREEEREGAISSEFMEGLHAMCIKGPTWPPTHCGRGGAGADATDPLTGKGRSDSGHTAEMQSRKYRAVRLGTVQMRFKATGFQHWGHPGAFSLPIQTDLGILHYNLSSALDPILQTARGISNKNVLTDIYLSPV